MTDRELFEKALEALTSLTSDHPQVKMQYSDILLVVMSLRKRLQQNDSRQLDWAKSQADHWKQHCFHLMKQLQEKMND